jgi:Arc/MetJ-type ribon-helix-helix transcriptional regulator
MPSVKIAITIDYDLLKRLDDLIEENKFPNRSEAVQEAIRDKLRRMKRRRLAIECVKLDSAFEQALADEGLTEDSEKWPEHKRRRPLEKVLGPFFSSFLGLPRGRSVLARPSFLAACLTHGSPP